MKKKLSIIIPSYNSNERLELALMKVCIFKSLEVIVVDDCGSQSCDILRNRFPNVIFYRQAINRGAGAARNKGLELASAEYITFMDADDFILSESVEELLGLLDGITDILYFSPTSHDVYGGKGKRHLKYEKMVLNYLYSENKKDLLFKYHVPWSKVFRCAFLIKNELKFDEVSASNDVIFSLESSLSCKNVKVYDFCFYSVLSHSEGLTGTDTIQRLLDRLDVAIRYNAKLRAINKSQYRVTLLPIFYRLLKIAPKIALKFIIETKLLISDWFPSCRVIAKFLGWR